MVLIDTTVWIDFFADRNEPHVATLHELIENEEDLSTYFTMTATSTILLSTRSSEFIIERDQTLNYRLSTGGYLAEIDRMNLEVREYLSLHPSELEEQRARVKASG